MLVYVVIFDFEIHAIYLMNPINSKYDKVYPMEFWAGFIGLSQDKTTKAIRPEIDWFVAHEAPIQQLEMQRKNGILLNNIAEIPDYVYQLKSIEHLSIVFLNKIILPKKLTTESYRN